ncbi:MAG TPA: tryptophan--tRNA ligase, partial [Bacteroidota bacterium]
RRFNQQYKPVFPEPEAKLTKFARLPGLDGRRMSKSIGNTIQLSDSPGAISEKMKKAVTDPKKVRKGDPGRPDICLVFAYHNKFNPSGVPEVRKGCESGALGCVDCKKDCARHISESLAPLRERRAYYEAHLGKVSEILADGEQRARTVAKATMEEVHEAMGMG